jgi:D-alanine-D-alanine ligase
MPNVLKVALLYGGRSGEHEISLRSAASVLRYLNKEKYHVIPIGMDKEGLCYLNTAEALLDYQDALPVKLESSILLKSLLSEGRFAIDVDVVFPVVHGPLYEDGALQGLLELAHVAYVGCNVLASALGMDKAMARRVVCDEEIQSAQYRLLPSTVSEEELSHFCEEVMATFGWPMFVKPCALGSSVGIHKVSDLGALKEAIADAHRYDQYVVVESFVKGREIELAVLENPRSMNAPFVSLPGEIVVKHEDGFYSYAAKYLDSDKTELVVPASLPEPLLAKLQHIAAEIFKRLRCEGMARVDFFVNDETGHIYFNEINTLPGFTSISMYPKMWEVSGLAYDVLLDKLIELAMMHHQRRLQRVTHYQ